MSHFFYTPEGRQVLHDKYFAQERSTYDIAKEHGTYPNVIRRALIKHGYTLRSKSDAQKKAIVTGRHPHPTKGKERPEETRKRIGDSVRKSKQGVQNGQREGTV